jgi:hypothetical protein
MRRTSVPHNGCFHTSYPNTDWREVSCGSATIIPYPNGAEAAPETIGSGSGDYAAQVTSGLINRAEGSFPSSTGVTGESGADWVQVTNGINTLYPNTFSFQLNTNTFSTPACSGATNPSQCLGWQQFIVQEETYGGSPAAFLYMQYWLLNYGPSCPESWRDSPSIWDGALGGYSGGDGVNCYMSIEVQESTAVTATGASSATLTVTAENGSDTFIYTAGGDEIDAVREDSILDLSQGWTQAEFNIFGDADGDEAFFNSGSTLYVQTSVENGTTNPPVCQAYNPFPGFTGETNNLNLAPQCCPYGGSSPGIQYMESNVSGATTACGSGGGIQRVATPYTISDNVTVDGGWNPTIEYDVTLGDSTPEATINYALYECGYEEVESGGLSSGGDTSFVQYSGEYNNCSLSGTMNATAPWYLPSPTTGIDF